jgi:hypothetical protein
VRAAQALRFRVFYGEMGARPDAATTASGLDADEYDAVADHLLVLDHDRGEGPEGVVGTYRLIRRAARRGSGASTRRPNTTSGRYWTSLARSWSWAAPAPPSPIARAGPCSCSGPASPPMWRGTTSG